MANIELLTKKRIQGFTLIELLVVIAILAVLATAVVVVLNPVEMVRAGRDSTRLSDLSVLNSALGIIQVDSVSASFGSSSVVYVSLPDTTSTCANLGLPGLPSGWSYRCVTTSTLTKVDGTGWVPVDFTQISTGSPLARLPVDPTNTASGGYYSYTPGGSWHIGAKMESSKYKMGGGSDRTASDGGKFPGLYEIGSNVSLLPIDYGDTSLKGYWPFEEGIGTSTYDASGTGNNGVLENSPSWATITSCKKGKCLNFDGNLSRVRLNSVSLQGSKTITAWVKVDTVAFHAIFGTALAQLNNNRFAHHNGSQYLVGTPTLTTSTWHHVAFVSDQSANSITYYLNGSQTDSFNSPSFTNTTVHIGIYDANNSFPFDGHMDEVRFYNRALSASEVSALYRSGQ